MKIKFKKLTDLATAPTYAKAGDAGADLYASETTVVFPQSREVIETGIAIEIPEGYVGYINPRSGLAAKNNITVLNSPGTIDSGYRGEIKVILFNHDKWDKFQVNRGDRIAQIVFHKFETAEFELSDELNESERGEGGFGSTGRSDIINHLLNDHKAQDLLERLGSDFDENGVPYWEDGHQHD